MQIIFQYHPDRKLIVTRWVGNITGEALIAHYGALFHREDFCAYVRELVDLTRVDQLQVSADQMRQIARLQKASGASPAFRTAFVAPRDTTYGMARMYGSYAEFEQAEFTHPFDTEEAAMAWLFQEG